MQSSEILIAKIKQFEGLKLNAYKCSAGVWTIGYGHTNNVKQGDTITQARAEQYLQDDIEDAQSYIEELNLQLTQGQYDALVDFIFNLGYARLAKSTLLKKIKAGATTPDIQKEFKRWVYANGKQQAGLIARREWEANRYAQ